MLCSLVPSGPITQPPTQIKGIVSVKVLTVEYSQKALESSGGFGTVFSTLNSPTHPAKLQFSDSSLLLAFPGGVPPVPSSSASLKALLTL